MRIRMMDDVIRLHTGNFSGSNAGKRVSEQGTGSVFGPQCKVTISKEGKRLSRQDTQSAQVERLMLRQQKESEGYKEEYARILDDIESLRNAVDSVGAAEDKDTIAKKQDALRRLSDLKARQEEENERQLKEAAGNIAGVSKEQEKIDKEHAELYVMLKSFEERDEDGSSGQDGGSGADSDSTGTEGAGGIGERVQEAASGFGVSAARRKMASLDVIDGLEEEGLSLLSEVDGMISDIYAMLDDARQAMADDSLSEEEKLRRVTDAGGMVRAAAQASYGDMARMRAKGLQMRQDARELSLRQIKEDPLEGVSDVRQQILDIGVEAAFSEAAHSVVDKASQELEDRVQDAIDERNETGAVPKEDEEEEKIEEKAEEIEQERRKEQLEEENAQHRDLEKSIS